MDGPYKIKTLNIKTQDPLQFKVVRTYPIQIRDKHLKNALCKLFYKLCGAIIFLEKYTIYG